MNVISQMTTSRTRPMQRDLPSEFLGAPHLVARTIPWVRIVGLQSRRVYHSPYRAQAPSCLPRFNGASSYKSILQVPNLFLTPPHLGATVCLLLQGMPIQPAAPTIIFVRRYVMFSRIISC